MDIEHLYLTKSQTESVNFDGGDLLIKGVAGSGKSIVLMRRALRLNKLAIENGVSERIIILTYAGSLVKHTRDLLANTPLNPCMIEVATIDGFCRSVYSQMRHLTGVQILLDQNIRKKYVEIAIQNHLSHHTKHRFHDIDAAFWLDEFQWIKEKNISSLDAYIEAERVGRGGKVRIARNDRPLAYELFVEYCSVLRKKHKLEWEDLYSYIVAHADSIPEILKYDHILVDEAQDLSYVKLRTAKLFARKSITVAADNAQKIYNTSFSWKEIGIDIRGKSSKSLTKTFRSTKQIVQLAESIMAINRAMQKDPSEYTDAVIPERDGLVPQVIRCSNISAEQQFVVGLIKKLLAQSHVIGILYRSYREKNQIMYWLYSARIFFDDISTNKGQPPAWSIVKPGVKLCTLHSSKGLEFDTIIIPRFSENIFPLSSMLENCDEEQIEEIKSHERNLLYVGMTRAKYNLYFTYSGTPSCYLSEFDPQYYNHIDNIGNIVAKPSRSIHIVPSPDSKSSLPVSNHEQFPQPNFHTDLHTDLHTEQAPEQCPVTNMADKPSGSVVHDGSIVEAHIDGTSKRSVIPVNTHSFPLQKVLIGKSVGDAVSLMRNIYIIDKIQ